MSMDERFKDLKPDDFGLEVKDESIVVKDYKLLPKIAYIESKSLFCLYYFTPNCLERFLGQGQNVFYFDGNVFVDAYERAKYTQKEKEDYFEAFFFNQFYKNANFVVKFIFKFFKINPTVLNSAFHQDKRKLKKSGFKSKIVVECKNDKIRRFWGVGKENARGSGKSSKKRQKNAFEGMFKEISEVQNEKLREIVRIAAENHDLNYYEKYFRLLLEFNHKKIVSKKCEKQIFDYFQKSVLDMQS